MIPCNRDPDLRRNLRTAILDTVKSTESHLRSLYAQLNALAPVSLLPTELLARVFHLLRDDQGHHNDARLPPSVAVTHVCRHWREVALNDSSLWSVIRDNAPRCNRRCITEMLIRSKNAPLDVEVYRPYTDLLHSLTHHSSRISRLSLSNLEDNPGGDGVQDLLETEAPVLEDLYMETLWRARRPIGVSRDPPVSTSGFRLFHQRSSKLRKIHLYNIHIPWSYFPKSNLTHLEIISESPDSILTPNTAEILRLGALDDLIDVIANSPCLERLSLKHCLVPTSLQPTLPETVIELPRLRQLDLSGPSSGVLRIFQSLHAPVLRVVALFLAATDQADVASWPTNTSSILSRFHQTGSVTVETLRLEATSDCGETKISVEGHPASFVAPAVPSSSIDETSISLEFQDLLSDSDQAHHEIIWQQACKTLRMVELESLFVFDGVPTDEIISWTQLFEQCTNVTKVHARGMGIESLLWSMRPRDPAPSGASQGLHEPTPALLFPKLARLSIEDLDFDFPFSTGERVYELVFKLFECRKRCSTPIRELCICNCAYSSTEADSLEVIIPKIRWDPNEDDTDSGSDSIIGDEAAH
ncbi:hypothetical protein BC834DRAFT_670830 [Gloeopeniophorella convolvens]|nr:hypothetical protein BC834DRAFT_670830 [Gloeopeniophorella convolvens]